MIVVDSSGWLEFLRGGPQSDQFAAALKDPGVLVPSIAIYEVFKVLRRGLTDDDALAAAAVMNSRTVAPLTADLAVIAARTSLSHQLSMADVIIYATAQAHGAELITSDVDFQDLPGVTYVPKGHD